MSADIVNSTIFNDVVFVLRPVSIRYDKMYSVLVWLSDHTVLFIYFSYSILVSAINLKRKMIQIRPVFDKIMYNGHFHQ